MTEAGDRVARLRRIAGVLLGADVRGAAAVRQGGSGLDLRLVRPPDARSVPAWLAGELRLRVVTHAWRLESRERVLAAGLDPGPARGAVRETLLGRTVSGIEIARPGLGTTLVFGDVRLRVFPVSSVPPPEGYPAWTLRTEQGGTLTVGPSGGWSRHG